MAEIQWEYRVITAGSTFSQPKDDVLEATLNELGSDGWELVTAHNQEGSNKIRLILKRQVDTRSVRKPWPGY